MPPIPALPAMALASPEAAAKLPGLAPGGFSDALFAFLSPESVPAISADDARALGWSPAAGADRRAGAKGEVATDAKPAKDDAPSDAAVAIAGLVALPVAAAAPPVTAPGTATPALSEATTSLRSAFDALASAMPRAIGSAGPEAPAVAAAPAERDKWSFDLLDAHFAAAQAASHAAAPHAAAPQPPVIDAPLASPAFREQATEAVRWMVREGESRAEISVKPAELGPIQVELRMVADRVEVTFVAAHPDTRDALQDQLPQLRDLLAESGLQLGQASVHDQSPRDLPFIPDSVPAGDPMGAEPVAGVSPSTLPRSRGGDHLVDTFA